MKQDGFTMVEMLMVTALIAILLGIATLSFKNMSTKSNVEAKMKQMQSDFMSFRINAMVRDTVHTVALTTSQYSMQYTLDGITKSPYVQSLKYPIAWTGGSANINFDPKGMAYDPTDTTGQPLTGESISASGNTAGAVYDCILVTATNINIGKMNGSVCVPK